MTSTRLAPAPAGIDVPPGLQGVVVTETELGDVRGQEGFYHYRQYSAVELAERRSLDDVWFLMLHGHLPTRDEGAAFAARVAAARHLPASVLDALPVIAASCVGQPLQGLRTALSLLGSSAGLRPGYDLDPDQRRSDAITLGAAVPTVVAGLHRLHAGLEPLAPQDGLGQAAAYLTMVTGTTPSYAQVRAVEQYLVLTVDHGFNASTFTARVVASTGADMAACLVAAVGALSGPLHGGAPSRALDSLDAIGTADRVEGWVRAQVLSGARIMGFGHPVYRTQDPRSRLLRSIAQGLAAAGTEPNDAALVELAVQVEGEVVRLLAELKPGRQLHANVEFYAGVVMALCGLPRELFTPTFAVARVLGWSANVLEQAADPKIIRPSARYVGPPSPAPVPAR